MFSYALLCLCVVSLVAGDVQRFNSRYSKQFQRLEAAPYPPSGWRPSGPEFQLPGQQSSYGPPQQEYGPPQQEYGPPQEEPSSTTTEAEVTTTESPTTTANPDGDAEEVGSGDETPQNEALTQEDRGVYYIYHPDGRLQKVNFATNDDVRNMAFSARLQYENVEPIRGPVFTYDPLTYVFRRL